MYTNERYELSPIEEVSAIAPFSSAGGDRVGEALAVSAEYLIIGAPGTDIDGVSNAGVVFVYDAQSDMLLFTLQSPTPGASDEFGAAVAIDGDLIAVGARNDDGIVTDGGAVFLFDATSGALIDTLLPENPEQFDRFGFSVAINDSYICVGLANDSQAGTNVGSVEVFDRDTHARIGKLLPDDPTNISGLGTRAAISGDTLAVGAYPSDVGGVDAGAVFVFDLAAMTQRYMVQGSDTASGDEFGSTLAVSADRLYVGSELNDTSGDRSGAVYMFDLETGDQIIRMRPHDFGDNYRFGSALGVDGDRLIIGAKRNSRDQTNGGRAYLFNARTGQLQAYFHFPTLRISDQLGVAVAVLGNTVRVSAARSNSDGNTAGLVYRFEIGDERYPDRIFQGQDCSNYNTDELGKAVDIDGNTLAASGYNAGLCFGGGAGVYIYDIPTMTRLRVITNAFGDLQDLFGRSVAIGSGVVAVGAPYSSDAATRSGRVDLFDISSGELITILRPEDPPNFSEFGYSLDIDDGILAVGAPGDDDGDATSSGLVYLYELPSGRFIETVTTPNPHSPDDFGFDLHLSNGYLLVGAPRADDASVGLGAAYLYDLYADQYLRSFLPVSVDGDSPRDFGQSVCTDGEIVLVGDPNANVYIPGLSTIAQAGELYVFDLETGKELSRLRAETQYAQSLFSWSIGVDETTIYAGYRRLYDYNSEYGPDHPWVERFDRKTFERKSRMLSSFGDDGTGFGQSIAVTNQYIAAGMAGYIGFSSGLGGAVFVYDTATDNACVPDLNADGLLDFFDVSAFLVAFTEGDLSVADLNADGLLDFFDVSAFLVAYMEGCP